MDDGCEADRQIGDFKLPPDREKGLMRRLSASAAPADDHICREMAVGLTEPVAKARQREAEDCSRAEPIDAETMYLGNGRVPCEGFMIREVGHVLRCAVNAR